MLSVNAEQEPALQRYANNTVALGSSFLFTIFLCKMEQACCNFTMVRHLLQYKVLYGVFGTPRSTCSVYSFLPLSAQSPYQRYFGATLWRC